MCLNITTYKMDLLSNFHFDRNAFCFAVNCHFSVPSLQVIDNAPSIWTDLDYIVADG
jgi:hypothetical protein